MPCRDWEGITSQDMEYMRRAEAAEKVYKADINKLKSKLDMLTQDMCYLTAELFDNGILEKYASNRILKWFMKHTEEDTKRVSKEMIKHYEQSPEDAYSPEDVANHFISKAAAVHPVSEYHKKWFNDLANEYKVIGFKILEKKRKNLKDEFEENEKFNNAISKLTPEEIDLIKKKLFPSK